MHISRLYMYVIWGAKINNDWYKIDSTMVLTIASYMYFNTHIVCWVTISDMQAYSRTNKNIVSENKYERY